MNAEAQKVLAIVEEICREGAWWAGRTCRAKAKADPKAALNRAAFQICWGLRAEIRKRVREQLA